MSCSLKLIPSLAIALTILVLPIYGQINMPCTASMLTSLTPCLAFIANSTTANNGTSSPTSACCSSLSSLTGSSMACACFVVVGNVPFQVPINRTLAASLPRACNMPGFSLQCKAFVSPASAPGPASFGPTISPIYAPSPVVSSTPTASTPTVTASTPTVTALAPQSDTTQDSTTPPFPSVETNTETPQSSGAIPSFSISSSLLLFASGVLVATNYY